MLDAMIPIKKLTDAQLQDLAGQRLPRLPNDSRCVADYGPLSEEARGKVIERLCKRGAARERHARIIAARAELARRAAR